jgi:type 1 glutamine amidotransferase
MKECLRVVAEPVNDSASPRSCSALTFPPMKIKSLAVFALAFAGFFSITQLRAADALLKVCMLSASDEYKSEESLGELQKLLESKYGAKCVKISGKEKGDSLPGIEALDDSDVMIVFTRRVTLPDDQLAHVKKFIASGKGIVGIRTASHAFQNWLEFDHEILGGDYNNHWPKPEMSEVKIEQKSSGNPVLAGVHPFSTTCTLYKNAHIAADLTLLLTARGAEHTEPVAWTRFHENARVFYTSLGTPDHFKNDDFVRMIVNAVFWSAKREAK